MHRHSRGMQMRNVTINDAKKKASPSANKELM